MPLPLYSRKCACAYCCRLQAEYVSHPDSTFSYHIANPENHTIIRHGHSTAEFHECDNCGLAFVTSLIDGQLYGILNAIVMGVEGWESEPNPNDYSAESVAQRLQRRKQRWSKVVDYQADPADMEVKHGNR